MSVDDNELDGGTDEGRCPFTVHGITGAEYNNLPIKALKAKALHHLSEGGKVLAIGHAETPESLFNNPQMYPQMFPWLFPYGLGGIGQLEHKGKLSSSRHKKHLLLYHDKRFQMDEHFPLVAFNHEQIKASVTAGFLLTNKSAFEDISSRVLSIDKCVLQDMAERLKEGIDCPAETDMEKQCYQLLRDVDHVGGHVEGSLTNKKYMRSEIWSLISYKGAPSWYITLSPSDERSPICLYFADASNAKNEFRPFVHDEKLRRLLVSQNPVAGARFFHLMIELFIEHVLGVKISSKDNRRRLTASGLPRGFYGQTDAFYGTVEQ
ncbi:hypothetical protein BJ138DRAFT_1013469, partial [Hygrophoropsis aurantiaca]